MKINSVFGNKLLVLVVSTIFLTPWGYSHFPALLLLFPLVLMRGGKKILYDKETFFLFFFCYSYSAILFVNRGIQPGVGTLLKFLIVPILFYLAGKIFVLQMTSFRELVKSLLFIFVAFTAVVYASIVSDIQENGYVSVSRNIQVLGEGGDLKNATGINSILSVWLPMLGLAFWSAANSFEKRVKFFLILFSVVSLLFSLRLGSRTGVSIVAVGVSALFLYNLMASRLMGKLRLIAILGCVVLVFVMMLGLEDITSSYQDRIDSDEFGASTAGGRVELWGYYAGLLLSYPFGDIPSMRIEFAYAHNYFLDIAKVSGLVPFVAIIIFTASTLVNFYKVVNGPAHSLLRNVLIAVNIAFYLVFMVEPVMEGCFSLLCLYMFVCGITNILAKSKGYCRMVSYGA